ERRRSEETSHHHSDRAGRGQCEPLGEPGRHVDSFLRLRGSLEDEAVRFQVLRLYPAVVDRDGEGLAGAAAFAEPEGGWVDDGDRDRAVCELLAVGVENVRSRL